MHTATARQAQAPTPPKPQAHLLAHGRLYRAHVSLPQALCPIGEPLHERTVFFDAPHSDPAAHLEKLLALAWNVPTTDWAEQGHIYNVTPACDLAEEGLSEDHDQRLFETSWGGLEHMGFAQPDRVDIFAAPKLKRRLLDTLATLPRQGGAA